MPTVRASWETCPWLLERPRTHLHKSLFFDSEGGVIHGLVHRHVLTEQFYCPACITRFHRDQFVKGQ